MNLLVPINWSILREREGTCPQCGTVKQFKYWIQVHYPFPVIECYACFYQLDMQGAVKDYFREKIGE